MGVAARISHCAAQKDKDLVHRQMTVTKALLPEAWSCGLATHDKMLPAAGLNA